MDILSNAATRPAQYSLSVVVPVYNEQEVLPEFHRRLGAALSELPARAEIIYIDDGSRKGRTAHVQRRHLFPRVARGIVPVRAP